MINTKATLNSANISGAFDAFFKECYGERWQGLREALEKPVQTMSFSYPGENDYFLDRASIIAARSLPIKPEDSHILDLCAAPGGKTLVLASSLGPSTTLIANERSAARRERLRRVLAEHLPKNVLDRIQVTSHDASRWCLYEQDRYDAILLDVPCSSERHLIHQSQTAQWTLKRSRFLAQRQYTMLASAVAAVKAQGYVLYSTCSISPYENDGVIEKLLKKKGARVTIEKVKPPIGEANQFGWAILPDKTSAGPMYFSLIRKTG